MSIKRWSNLGKAGIKALSKWARPEITKVNLSLTGKCNQRCITCNIWRNNGSAQELPLADVYAILKANPNLMWVSLTGGEPTLNSRFADILNACMNWVPMVNIVTNGQQTDLLVNAVGRALNNTPESHIIVIHISLLGEQATHEAMTDIKGSHAHVMETVAALKKLGQPDRLIIGFEHLISRYNPGEYKYVQYKANRLGVGLTYTFEQEAGYYQNKNHFEFKYEIPKVSFTLNPIDIVKNTFLLDTARRAGCVAGEYSCWVMPDRTVYPCFFSIPKTPAYSLADTNYQLKTKYFKDIRAWVKGCEGCWTPCESYTTLIYRPMRALVSK